MKELTELEKKALEKLLEHLDLGLDQESIEGWFNDYTITVNLARDLNEYVYIFDEFYDCAINIATLDIVEDKKKLDDLFS